MAEHRLAALCRQAPSLLPVHLPTPLGTTAALEHTLHSIPERLLTAQNAPLQDSSTQQMYVADLDMTQPERAATPTVRVTVPSSGAATRTGRSGSGSGDQSFALTTGGLRMEAQIAQTSQALQQARTELTVREEEVTQLQTQLADRDRSLHLTKSELIETRVALAENTENMQVRGW